VNKSERAALLEWVAEHRCCSVCWWPESDGRRRLEVHHLVGGAGRKHDIRNYLRLCSNCHTVLHSGSKVTGLVDLNARILLGVKQECDPDNYDPAFLASLKLKKHLGYDPEPLPEYYAEQRQRNVRGWNTRTQ
jgi:HNH endonuclease